MAIVSGNNKRSKTTPEPKVSNILQTKDTTENNRDEIHGGRFHTEEICLSWGMRVSRTFGARRIRVIMSVMRGTTNKTQLPSRVVKPSRKPSHTKRRRRSIFSSLFSRVFVVAFFLPICQHTDSERLSHRECTFSAEKQRQSWERAATERTAVGKTRDYGVKIVCRAAVGGGQASSLLSYALHS